MIIRFLLLLLACLSAHGADKRFIGPGSFNATRRALQNQTPYLILTNSTDRIGMYIRGTGNLSIDWGNGSNTVLALQNSTNYALSNMYGSSAMRTIVMRGNITRIISQGTVETSFGGDLSTLKSLLYLACDGSNTLGGSVEGLTGITYLACTGSNTLSGSVSGMSRLSLLYCNGSNTLSGNINNLTNLEYISVKGSNTITGWEQCATNATAMSMMTHGGATPLTQAQVDGVLYGFWQNRDVAKARATERTINLGVVNDAAPSAAGLAVKTNLAAYKSPNNTGPMFWTVTTK